MKEKHLWATSYAMTADQLYTGFDFYKTLKLERDQLPVKYKNCEKDLCGSIFRYCMYLMAKDIVENKATVKLPTPRAYLEMNPVSGEDFVKARQNGAFEDVDFLASNFTGYTMVLRMGSRYGTVRKRIYLSSLLRDRITELTNKGVAW